MWYSAVWYSDVLLACMYFASDQYIAIIAMVHTSISTGYWYH